MEHCDGSVIDINGTFADLGQKCLQLLSMHALSGCDTTSYPYGKGRVSSLNAMVHVHVSENYQGLATIDDVVTTHTELINTAMLFFVALYSTSMESARYNIFRKKRYPNALALSENICESYATQHTWDHLKG